MKTVQKGFTLLEILIAMIIISIGVVSFISMQQSTWSGTRKSNNTLLAGQIIERKIERLRLDIAEDPENNFPYLIDSKNNMTESEDNGITITWQIRPYFYNGLTVENLREIELLAEWRGLRKDSLVVITCLGKNF